MERATSRQFMTMCTWHWPIDVWPHAFWQWHAELHRREILIMAWITWARTLLGNALALFCITWTPCCASDIMQVLVRLPCGAAKCFEVEELEDITCLREKLAKYSGAFPYPCKSRQSIWASEDIHTFHLQHMREIWWLGTVDVDIQKRPALHIFSSSEFVDLTSNIGLNIYCDNWQGVIAYCAPCDIACYLEVFFVFLHPICGPTMVSAAKNDV